MEINKMNKTQLIEACEYFGFPKEEWEHLKVPELKEYVNSLMESIEADEEEEMEVLEQAIIEKETELEPTEKISKEEQKEILIDLMNSEEEAPMDTYETLETPDSKPEQKIKPQPKVKLFDKFLKRIK